MAFVAPNNLLYGIAELPARLYGGVVYSRERINNHQEAQNRFIPLENTSIFRRRELLFPRPATVPVPIVYIRAADHNTELERMKRIEADTYLKPEYHTHQQNRNLLAGEAISPNTVRLWCVDDNSNRTQVHELPFQFDIPTDPHLPIRANRDSDPWEQAGRIELDSGALELRAYDQREQTNRLFIRTETDLKLYDSEARELSTIYKWPLRYFERVAYMDDLAVVSNEGMVFFGQIGSEDFARVKADDKIISVSTTDSPAELLLVSKDRVIRADVRSTSKLSTTVFSLNKDEWNFVKPISQFGVNYLTERERIWHVKNVAPERETYLVTTTQRIYAFDRRMSNLPLFYTNHFNFNGGEYVLTGGPFFHQELELDVYQYFSLSRFLKPCISNWAIGWNRKEAVWTSMGPKCDLDSFEDILALSQSQAHLPLIPDKARESFPEVTRAIHYQHFGEILRPNENRALLFRQTDNGQIWFDSIQFAKPKAYCPNEGVEKEPQPTRASIEEIIDFLSDQLPLPPFWEFVDDGQLDSIKDTLEIIDYPKLLEHFDATPDRWRPAMETDYSQLELDDVSALMGSNRGFEYEPIVEPAVEPASDGHVFSKIVIDMAAKTKSLMAEDRSGPRIRQPAMQINDELMEDDEFRAPPQNTTNSPEPPMQETGMGDRDEGEDWY